ncbi:MAG: tetratricopeptide repeat protein [Bacteroidetes bacterium]|nr:tetratricopeptide repeat protein [Rhodothermia bacterium]MCX7907881.1 tetratricopeptide repeat protein [Bacteroidota bacterium]MDW8284714.1 tetratricopeptide repeat protein [Bacteroidota bacterium]
MRLFGIGPLLFVALLLLGGCAANRPLPPATPPQLEVLELGRPALTDQERALELFTRALARELMDDLEAAEEGYARALLLNPEEPGILHALAQVLGRRGRLREAIGYAEQAVRLDSMRSAQQNARWYRQTLAELYIQAGLLDRAIAEYERLAARFRRDKHLWSALAELYLQANQVERALAALDTLLTRSGPEPELFRWKLELLQLVDDTEGALKTLEAWWRSDPEHPQIRRQLLEHYWNLGRWEEARRVLQQADPQDVEAQLDWVELLDRLGRTDSVRLMLEALVRSPGLGASSRLRLGELLHRRALSQEGTLGEAERLLEVLFEQDPEQPELSFWLGDLRARLGRPAEALKLLEKAATRNPQDPQMWFRAVQVALEARDADAAIRLGQEAVELYPGQPALLLLLGSAYLEQQRPQEAISHLRKGLEVVEQGVSPELRAPLLGALADAYAQLGSTEEADSLYEAALGLDPENPVLLNNYAYHLAEGKRRLDRALSMALRAVDADPQNASFLDTLGWIYFQMGRYEEAVRWLERAVATGQASPVVLEHLGDAYTQVGRLDEARVLWRRALERNPENVRLRQKLGGR